MRGVGRFALRTGRSRAPRVPLASAAWKMKADGYLSWSESRNPGVVGDAKRAHGHACTGATTNS